MANNNNKPVDDKDVVKSGNGPRNANSGASEQSSEPVEPTTTPPAKETNKKSSVEERMEKLMSVVEAQQATIEQMAEDKKSMEQMINNVADKARLHNWEDKVNPQNFNVKKMRLAVYNGKVVLAWSDMTANNVFKAENKAWVEELKTTIIYEDGEKEDVLYKSWMLNKKNKEVILKLDSIDPVTGIRIVTVEDPEGNTYNVDVKFINP